MPSAARKPRSPGRTTRDDWLRAALSVLIQEGVDSVKVLTLAERLDCARSSFYWFFKDRAELLDTLLDHWQSTNTRALIAATELPSASITEALALLYRSWINQDGFDTQLDFAIRDWARRSDAVRAVLLSSDNARIAAIAGMFRRFGYAPAEADVRGRMVYFTQIGYATIDQREGWEVRNARGETYLYCMTGQRPSAGELAILMVHAV